MAGVRTRLTAGLGAGALLVPFDSVGTDATYTHTTTVGERSIHAVRVVVSDGDDTHTHPSAT
jgi:hypothetical protein